ncbi:ankyrin repeat domain-containing protein [Natronobiforma cellulositropha]|uniref:ankyrin repeat domain-containing protein n=1 Tax=Natronobiforma cellulositropha TaxID=1679076 RepID=UPI0021D5E258|nr:ankyrin repeat domain-containing protein [Natronobiforma cellulositropha]
MTTADDPVDDETYSDLERAILAGDRAAVETELETGETGEGHRMAVHTALLGGRTDIALELVDRRIGIDTRDNAGATPLHRALELDELGVAKALVQAGADVTVEDEHGNQPLWRAVFRGQTELVATLVEHGADPHHENVAGRSPYSLATEYDVAEILEALERA